MTWFETKQRRVVTVFSSLGNDFSGGNGWQIRGDTNLNRVKSIVVIVRAPPPPPPSTPWHQLTHKHTRTGPQGSSSGAHTPDAVELSRRLATQRTQRDAEWRQERRGLAGAQNGAIVAPALAPPRVRPWRERENAVATDRLLSESMHHSRARPAGSCATEMEHDGGEDGSARGSIEHSFVSRITGVADVAPCAEEDRISHA